MMFTTLSGIVRGAALAAPRIALHTLSYIQKQRPLLFPALALNVATMLIPETWIIGPILTWLGFGRLGPIGGTLAAWLQCHLWGGAVGAGSWFAMLQAAGMGVIPVWAGFVVKAPLVIGSLLAMVLPGRFTRA